MNKDSYHSMKRGLALSLVVHVILISWGAVQFTNSVSLPQPLEAIPITLAPLSEEFSSQQGAVEAPLHAIPAVKPTTAPQEIEDARHIGEGQRDSLAPFQPKEKPRSVETTPPLPSEHASEISERREPTEAKTEEISKAAEEASKLTPEIPLSAPEEASKLTPEIPLSAPEEASKLTPEEPLSAPEEASKLTPELPVEALEEVSKIVSKPVHKNEERILPKELAPTVQKAPAEQVVQQAPKIALPEKPLLPHFKPKFNKELPMKNGAALNQKTSKLNKKNKEEKTIEDILALEENNLLNRARSQGGGAKRSHTPEALGARKNIHDTTKMAQTLVNIAGGCIQQKLKLVALGGDLKNRPIVRLRFYLDREGMVVGEPIIDPISGLKSQQAIMIRQVYAAVFSCQPYVDLPRDQYDLWGQGFDFNVDPLQEIR
ncbi:cell envelope biogenesis protein TolA [Bartonella krasnovii]|uniref:cell envelope biogenesis protein TolA n=1 Tax=Bartonella krasnovii TaxID=2267275 RepID=UPI001F4C705C|nr:cell envelope biogenesis protein TolA [Bartonella krasnovii]UNF50136.1 cell envelope biogenesis protein TolA [Bartonella krasnovii]